MKRDIYVVSIPRGTMPRKDARKLIVHRMGDVKGTKVFIETAAETAAKYAAILAAGKLMALDPHGLLCCPFDGARAGLNDVGGRLRYQVSCDRCGAATARYATRGLAEVAWNRRGT